ncbi:hypothetical protein L596_016385 [Steinernema carpocapsae]|uniref:DNA2/NAM7 helicase-like C-terminal domain-containing protein n=1 Tax=Steinernema carpocapsae TaxID=34508 RepID=A0A4U5NHU1_STECR|nr:hypothetical protein L596_016385 [Steinernema carpocapsae]
METTEIDSTPEQVIEFINYVRTKTKSGERFVASQNGHKEGIDRLDDPSTAKIPGFPCVPYRVFAKHGDGDLLVLQAIYHTTLPKQFRKYPFLLLDSRAVIGPHFSEEPFDFNEIQLNDEVWVITVEYLEGVKRSYKMVERNGITTVTSHVPLYAQTVCFTTRNWSHLPDLEICSDRLLWVLTRVAKNEENAELPPPQPEASVKLPKAPEILNSKPKILTEPSPTPEVSFKPLKAPEVLNVNPKTTKEAIPASVRAPEASTAEKATLKTFKASEILRMPEPAPKEVVRILEPKPTPPPEASTPPVAPKAAVPQKKEPKQVKTVPLFQTPLPQKEPEDFESEPEVDSRKTKYDFSKQMDSRPMDFENLNRDILQDDEDEYIGDCRVSDKRDLMPEERDSTKLILLNELEQVSCAQLVYGAKKFLKKQKSRPPLSNVEPRDPLQHNFRTNDRIPHNEEFSFPIAYRVIAVLPESNQLILESLFRKNFPLSPSDPDIYRLQYLILDQDSYEGPNFNRSGFNIYDAAVNDLVCVFEICAYRGPQPKDNWYERNMYSGPVDDIIFKAYAHCFLGMSVFKTLYGMANNEKTIISGIDEPVDVDRHRQIYESVGDSIHTGDMFRVDVIPLDFFNAIGHVNMLRAGSTLTYATDRGPKTMVLVAGIKLNNIMLSYQDPFNPKWNLHIIDQLDRQAAAFALGKYGEEMCARIDLMERAYPVKIKFNNREDSNTGTIEFLSGYKTYNPDESLRQETELKVVVKDVGSFVIQVYDGRRFEVGRQSNLFLNMNRKLILNNKEDIVVTVVDRSPNDNPAIRFLCNGGFARSMKRQAQAPEGSTPVQTMFQAIRTRQYPRDMIKEFNEVQNVEIESDVRFKDETIRLDNQQEAIVKAVVCLEKWSELFMISACAGAGKSLCSVAILKESIVRDPTCVQLVCSAANRAVDNLAESLHRLGDHQVRAIRIYSGSQRSKMNFQEPQYGFNAVVKKLVSSSYKYGVTEMDGDILEYYLKAYERLGRIAKNPKHRDDFEAIEDCKNRMKKTLKEVSEIVIRLYKPQVILTTIDFFLNNCLHARSVNTLCMMKFDRVLIDEASQLEEARFSLLMNRNWEARQFVVVGDPKQLPPHYPATYDQNLKELFGTSTLAVLGNTSLLPKLELTIGYRMHPELLKLTSVGFYQDTLQTSFVGPWLNKEVRWQLIARREAPIVFANTGGTAEISGTSRINVKEANLAAKLVEQAVCDGVEPEDIGVICLYKAQRDKVAKLLTKVHPEMKLHKRVDIATVDSYQGREKDYIIVLTTRSDFNTGDFFYNKERANVATSRAILGMVILTEDAAVKTVEPWNKLYEHSVEKGLYEPYFRVSRN